MADEQVVKLTYTAEASGLIRALQDIKNAGGATVEQLNAVDAGIAKLSASQDVLNTSSRRTIDTLSGQTRFLQSAARAYDPLSYAVQRAQADVDRLNGVIAAGGPNAARAAQLLGPAMVSLTAAQQRASQQTAVFTEVTQNSTKALAYNRGGLMEIQAAFVNTAQSLASGMAPWRVFQTQIFQVAGGAVQAVGATTALRAVAGYLGPITAIGSALIVFGDALAHAMANRSTAREFGNILHTLGTDSLVTGQDLTKAARQLNEVGVSFGDARTMLADIARTPGINPKFGPSIIELGHDIATYLGQADQTVKITGQLTDAFASGPEAVIRFANSLNGLTAAQIEDIRVTNIQQGTIAAQQKAWEYLRANIAHASDAMTGWQQSTRQLSLAWQGLIERLAASSFIQSAVDGFANLLSHVGDVVGAIDKLWAGIQRLGNTQIGQELIGFFGGLGNIIEQSVPSIDRLWIDIDNFSNSQLGHAVTDFFAGLWTDIRNLSQTSIGQAIINFLNSLPGLIAAAQRAIAGLAADLEKLGNTRLGRWLSGEKPQVPALPAEVAGPPQPPNISQGWLASAAAAADAFGERIKSALPGIIRGSTAEVTPALTAAIIAPPADAITDWNAFFESIKTGSAEAKLSLEELIPPTPAEQGADWASFFVPIESDAADLKASLAGLAPASPPPPTEWQEYFAPIGQDAAVLQTSLSGLKPPGPPAAAPWREFFDPVDRDANSLKNTLDALVPPAPPNPIDWQYFFNSIADQAKTTAATIGAVFADIWAGIKAGFSAVGGAVGVRSAQAAIPALTAGGAAAAPPVAADTLARDLQRNTDAVNDNSAQLAMTARAWGNLALNFDPSSPLGTMRGVTAGQNLPQLIANSDQLLAGLKSWLDSAIAWLEQVSKEIVPQAVAQPQPAPEPTAPPEYELYILSLDDNTAALKQSVTAFQAANQNEVAAIAPLASGLGNNLAAVTANTAALAQLTTGIGTLATKVDGLAIGGAAPAAAAIAARAPGASDLALSGDLMQRVMGALVQVESAGNPNAISPAGAMGLGQLMPGTARQYGVVNPFDPQENLDASTRYLTDLVRQFKNLDLALQAYNWGPGNLSRAIAAGTPAPAQVQQYSMNVLSRAGVSPGAAVTAAAPAVAPRPADAQLAAQLIAQLTPRVQSQPLNLGNYASGITIPKSGQIGEETQALREQRVTISQTLDITKQYDAEAKIMAAAQKAAAEAVKLFTDPAERQQYVLRAITGERERQAIELQKSTTLQNMETAGVLQSATAYQRSLAAGLEATAVTQAHTQAVRQNADATQLAQTNLDAQAGAAILSAQKQLAGIELTVAANQRLGDAAMQGAAAEHRVTIENDAMAKSQDAVAAAMAAYSLALKGTNQDEIASAQAVLTRATALEAETKAQLAANEAAKARIEIGHQLQTIANERDVIQLEASMMGQSTQEVEKQVALLRTKQDLLAKFPDFHGKELDLLLQEKAANIDMLNALKERQAQQERWTQTFVNIGQTIDSQIVQQLENAFSGQKVENWGVTAKKVLASIATQLLDVAVIKPAIGSVLSLLGLGSDVTSQFGTLGGILSGLGGIGVPSSRASFSGTTASGESITGTLTQGVGMLGNLGGGGGGGPLSWLFGGGGGGGNAISGGWSPVSGFTAGPLANIGLTLGDQSFSAGVSGVGGLTGTEIIGGAGGASSGGGLFSGIGSFINDTIGGSLGFATSAGSGSGLFGTGLLGSTSLTSILGPIGLIGGLAGLLLPLLGIGKGSQNYASSANINALGQISTSGQNEQNSKTAANMLQNLAPLVQALSSVGLQMPSIGATYGFKTGLQTGINTGSSSSEVHYARGEDAVADTARRLIEALHEINPQFNEFADVLNQAGDAVKAAAADTGKSFDDLKQSFAALQTTYEKFRDVGANVGIDVENLRLRFQSLAQTIINAQIDRISTSITTLIENVGASLDDFTAAFTNLWTQYQTALQEANAAGLLWGPVTERFDRLAATLQGPELNAALTGLQTQFKSLQVGQYAAALASINSLYAELTAQANQFNLPISPVTAGRNQATAALRASFNQNVQDLILSITDPVAYGIMMEKRAGEERIADAKAVGGYLAAVERYNALNLQKVTDSLKEAGEAAKLTAQGFDSLTQTLTQLRSGSLSGLTGAQSVTVAQKQYTQLADFVAGKLWQPGKVTDAIVQQLAQAATALVTASQQAYGEGPQTVALRDRVTRELTNIEGWMKSVGVTGTLIVPQFAEGTLSTPPGAKIVGERGPELLIEKGGAAVIPLLRQGATPSSGSGQDNSRMMEMLLSENRAIRQELTALRRQVAAGHNLAHDDAQQLTRHVAGTRTDMQRRDAMPMRKVV